MDFAGGRYKLLRKVGSGGEGEVWLARDRLRPGISVALKRMALEGREDLVRFLRGEFQVLSTLEHPRLARVHDLGRYKDADGGEFLYFTREYVQGSPLEVRPDGMRAAQALRTVLEIARALRPLHRSGLVHGDLKPGNVIVDAQAGVRLIDFALAGTLARGAESRPTGTLRYMSPEMLEGKVPDGRGDLYALGVLLVELVTGRAPFEGGASDVISGHLEGGVAFPPEWKPPAGSRPSRRALDSLVSKLSAREPALRFPTLDEAEAAIMRALGTTQEDPHLLRAALGGMHARSRQRDRVLSLVEEFAGATEAGAGTVLVTAAGGGGRSGFLRAIRWELQMKGALTVDLDFSRERDARAQQRSLLRQVVWHLRSAGANVDPELVRFAVDEDVVQQRKLEAVAVAQVAALVAVAPVVVLIDDLDLAAASMCRLMRVVGGTSADPPLVFVATAPHGDEVSLPVLGAGPREEVVLDGLSDEDLAGMVRLTLGRADQRLVERLREVSGGNPALACHFLERAAREGPRLDGVEAEPLPGRLASMWRTRMHAVDGTAREVMDALAVHAGTAPAAWLADVVGEKEIEPAVVRLGCEGLVEVRADGGFALAAGALCAAVMEDMDQRRRSSLHGAWAAVLAREGGSEHLVIAHRAQAGEARQVAVQAVEATKRLRSLGDLVSAEKLLAVVDRELVGRGPGRQVRLALAEILHEVGRSEESVSLLETLDAARPEVRLARARALFEVGRREEAVEMLASLVEDQDADQEVAVAAQRELALLSVHRGRYDQARSAADQGLDGLGAGQEAARADFMCTRGLAFLYEERLDEATRDVSEALGIARRIHDGRLRSRAHWALAMIHQRRGDLYEAAASYRQAIDICTRTDDTGRMSTLLVNIGTLLHRMGEVDEAIDRYLGAIDYSRAAGRTAHAVIARTNLGHLFAQLGLTERARLEGERILAVAERIGQDDLVARAHGVIGEAARQSGRVEDAAVSWRRAVEFHVKAGNQWEATESRLDLASALADLDPPAADEAQELLGSASAFLEGASSSLLEVRLALARSRLALALGQAERAVEQARSAIAGCRRMTLEWDDYSWQAFELMARAHQSTGSDLLYARTLKRAGEALEEASLKVPARFARAFSTVEVRRRIVDELARLEPLAGRGGIEGGGADARGAARGETEWRDTLMRLMEINRRIARTRDPEVLVDVILDSAVEFTGAERGLLLLPVGDGGLEIASARDFYEGSVPEEHMEFSTSIARQVHASGEPVITVSAMEDERFDKARSVHELKLQSILCLPIKGRRAILGVLYLENRLRSGKFQSSDRDMLAAFSDQLAIAMETTRLLDMSREQRAELERLTEERARLLERRTQELDEARRDLKMARSRLVGKSVFRDLVGSSAEMRRIFSLIERVGESDVPVVITGESGTGKEMVARAIHAGEARSKGPFVAVNCGAVPGELLESELFGHVRGAFTGAVRDKKGVFALASGGTLLLDEVGDMPTKMQLDLLRVLQERTVRPVGSEKEVAVDVRVLAASQKPLDALVREDLFREDLYYRLRVVEVRIPPLKERRDDIPLLIDHFIVAFALRFGTERKSVSRRAVRMLIDHEWPGNVRQLEHALLNAWVLSDSRILDIGDFESLAAPVSGAAPAAPAQASPSSIEDEERRAILDALKDARWNKTEAARKLGIPRRTFYRRLRKFGLLK